MCEYCVVEGDRIREETHAKLRAVFGEGRAKNEPAPDARRVARPGTMSREEIDRRFDRAFGRGRWWRLFSWPIRRA